MELKKVLVSDIMFMEGSLRGAKSDDATIVALANDIEARGLLNLPSIVESEVPGKYYVVDGTQRMTAIKLLQSEGRKINGEEIESLTLPLRETADANSILMDQISGNFNTKKTSNPEYLRALYKLTIGDKRFTVSDLAKKIGMTENYLWSLFNTLKLNEDTRALMADGKITIANAIRLSDLVGKVSDEELSEFTVQAETMTGAEFAPAVEARLKEVKAGKTEKSSEFVPVKKLMDKASIEARFDIAQKEFDLNPNNVNEAVLLTFKTLFQVDDASIARQKSDWEAKKAAAEAARAKRAAEREANKANEMVEALKAQGYNISK